MLFFPTVPSANTLVRWVNESAFVSIVQTRPCLTFGRPVHLRGSPHRLRPGSSPHAFRIPSHDGHPALRRTNFILRPARHYRRFWIWPSSSERQKDFNLPEQRAAQHTLCPLLTSPARSGWITPSSMVIGDKREISRGKFSRLQRTAAGLHPVPWMDMGFVVICPLARPRLPQIQFLSIGSRLCSTLLSHPASRRRPCASLSLRVHHVVKRTFTSRLLNMLGTPNKNGRITLRFGPCPLPRLTSVYSHVDPESNLS